MLNTKLQATQQRVPNTQRAGMQWTEEAVKNGNSALKHVAHDLFHLLDNPNISDKSKFDSDVNGLKHALKQVPDDVATLTNVTYQRENTKTERDVKALTLHIKDHVKNKDETLQATLFDLRNKFSSQAKGGEQKQTFSSMIDNVGTLFKESIKAKKVESLMKGSDYTESLKGISNQHTPDDFWKTQSLKTK